MKFRYHIILSTLCFIVVSCRNVELPCSSLLHLPKATSISIDGKTDDWAEMGLAIPIVADKTGTQDLSDFSANARLAWDEDNVYFMVTVKDDSTVSLPQLPLWKNDGIEIFLSENRGTDRMIQYLVYPFFSSRGDGCRVDRMNYLTGISTSGVTDLIIASSVTEWGYSVEIAIPFSVLGFRKSLGDTLGINCYVLDNDGTGKSDKYSWHFNDNTYLNHDALYVLKLTDTGKERVLLERAWLEDTSFYHVQLFSFIGDLSGEFCLFAGERKITSALAEKWDSGEVVRFEFHKTLVTSLDELLSVISGDKIHAVLSISEIPNVYKSTPEPNEFESEIQLFEKQDKVQFPPQGAILFIGSSSIRLWKTLKTDFERYQVINRGFGGAKTTDILHFFDRIVAPYQPKVIVYYTGTNDLASGSDAVAVVNNVERFVQRVGKTLPGTKVLILNNSISVSRTALQQEFRRANQLLEQRLANYPFASYVDVNSAIVDDDGMPRPDLFVADSTHLNPEGYKAWLIVLKPALHEVAGDD